MSCIDQWQASELVLLQIIATQLQHVRGKDSKDIVAWGRWANMLSADVMLSRYVVWLTATTIPILVIDVSL